MAHVFCTECGAKLEKDANFCGGCGASVKGDDSDSARPTAVATAVAPAAPSHVARVAAAEPAMPLPQPAVAAGGPVQPAVAAVAHTTLLTVMPTKSVAVAVLLAMFFGPVGMFYSTIAGGVTMLIITLIVAPLTLLLGLFITWPICVVWAAIAVNRHNATMIAAATGGTSAPN